METLTKDDNSHHGRNVFIALLLLIIIGGATSYKSFYKKKPTDIPSYTKEYAFFHDPNSSDPTALYDFDPTSYARLDSLLKSWKKDSLESSISKSSHLAKTADANDKMMLGLDINGLMKIVLTVIFSLVAFYIILSKKYNKETQKWAFSALSLIAGVWIGSAT